MARGMCVREWNLDVCMCWRRTLGRTTLVMAFRTLIHVMFSHGTCVDGLTMLLKVHHLDFHRHTKQHSIDATATACNVIQSLHEEQMLRDDSDPGDRLSLISMLSCIMPGEHRDRVPERLLRVSLRSSSLLRLRH
jgi:hypothetical protein